MISLHAPIQYPDHMPVTTKEVCSIWKPFWIQNQDHIMQARTEGDKGWSHMYLLYGPGPFLDLDCLITPLNEPWPLITSRWWAWCGWSPRTRSILTLIEQHKQTSWSFHHLQFYSLSALIWSLVSVQQVYMWPPLEVILGRQLAIGYVGDASRRIFVAAIACRGVQQIVRGDDCAYNYFPNWTWSP